MELKKIVGKYCGGKKITSAVESTEKTYLGNSKITLGFDDKTEQSLPLAMAEAVVSNEPTDPTELQGRKIRPVAEKILGLLADSELKKEDMEYMLNITLPNSIQESLNAAQEKMWGKKGYEVTLMDVEKVLNPPKTNGNKRRRKSK